MIKNRLKGLWMGIKWRKKTMVLLMKMRKNLKEKFQMMILIKN